MESLPEYTAVVRTLGKAGEKYQRLLSSLENQTHKPSAILIYLAEGYDKPSETIGKERIIYVPKGMVAQRALAYDEVTTEWMLFLDDDMEIAPAGVETILRDTLDAKADVCAIDGFPHHKLPLAVKIKMCLLLSSLPRIGKHYKGYTISRLGVELYNPNPKFDYAWSTTNSGNAFICKKDDFLKINFQEDLWLDDAPYAYPEDRVMFYKMHLAGLTILTHYNSGFIHLDAGTSVDSSRKAAKIAYSEARNNYIFNHLYFKPNLSTVDKIINHAFSWFIILPGKIITWIRNFGNREIRQERRAGIENAKKFLREYKRSSFFHK